MELARVARVLSPLQRSGARVATRLHFVRGFLVVPANDAVRRRIRLLPAEESHITGTVRVFLFGQQVFTFTCVAAIIQRTSTARALMAEVV